MREFLIGLWRDVFGEPPPLADDAQLLGQVLIESLPPLPPYEIGRTVDVAGSDQTGEASTAGRDGGGFTPTFP